MIFNHQFIEKQTHILIVYNICWNKKNCFIQILIFSIPPQIYTLKTLVFETFNIHPFTLYLIWYITQPEVETKTGKSACLFHLIVKQKYK